MADGVTAISHHSDCFNGAATARSRMEADASIANAASPGFNGAATARSRMGQQHHPLPHGQAASMGPRPLGRGWPNAVLCWYDL